MAMNRKQVQMLTSDGSRGKGDTPLLPNAEADALIARGVAKLFDPTKPDTKPAVGPTEFKPAAPFQVKK